MEYNPALDGVRAIAVLAVLAFHCQVPGFSGGFFGVDIFFVLSGYLITTLLAREWQASGRIVLTRFYWNRFVRLTPPLFAMLAAVAFLGIATGIEVAIAGIYLGDVYYPAIGADGLSSSTRHTWSLAVEEHFYLLWPLALPFFLRARNPAATLFAAFIAVTAWRLALWPVTQEEMTYFRFDARLSGLVLGSATAVWKPELHRATLDRLQVYCPTILAFACLVFVIYTPVSLIVALPMVELASAGLIIAATDPTARLHAILSSRPLVVIGTLSYAIYLWHFPIAWSIRGHFDWWIVLAVTLVASLLLAAASRRFIELPSRRFRSTPIGHGAANEPGVARADSGT